MRLWMSWKDFYKRRNKKWNWHLLTEQWKKVGLLKNNVFVQPNQKKYRCSRTNCYWCEVDDNYGCSNGKPRRSWGWSPYSYDYLDKSMYPPRPHQRRKVRKNHRTATTPRRHPRQPDSGLRVDRRRTSIIRRPRHVLGQRSLKALKIQNQFNWFNIYIYNELYSQNRRHSFMRKWTPRKMAPFVVFVSYQTVHP